MENKTIQTAIDQLHESDGVLKLLCINLRDTQIKIINEVLDRNLSAIENLEKLINE